MKVKEADRKFLARDMPAKDLEIVRSDGNFLFDSKGKKYIDFLMGWCVGNIGWGNNEIKKKISQYNGPDYVRPYYLYKAWAELAELLAKITPGKLQKSFRATGGTEAVEIALQAAMSHTKRHKFVSIEGSYHGHSIGAMSVGASDFRSWYKNLLPDCYKINPPVNMKAADKLEELLKRRDIAALIMEPIICSLGVEIPTKEFMSRAQAICKKFGTLLIMDEICTGFGRTGKLFASEYFDIEPDIMCLAKAITGGYGGMGATIVTKEVAKSMEYIFSNYSTYGWYPLSTEVAITNIKYILKHKKKLEENTNEMSKYFVERLSKFKFKYPAKIRAKGLAIGIEFEQTGYATEIVIKAQGNGVLFSQLSQMDSKIIVIFPALNIDRKTAGKGLDILEKCL